MLGLRHTSIKATHFGHFISNTAFAPPSNHSLTMPKRAADEEGATTRSHKVAKTDSGAGSKAKKGGPKAPMNTKEFKSTALPLHVNLTHTPPTAEKDSAVHTDPGFINTVTLLPSNFNTGSYGWKGNRRIAVEIEKDGKKEKVQVQLTINATVLGSKNAEDGEEDGDGDGNGEADDVNNADKDEE
ncbi:hypothetical protein DL96DRAFT_1156127 [Flagelloscypha sp. PMI_526]|nr:hypothetical protein DL96DRAFT_1156127 [Flagelloscypha sp. PMI_526]